MRRYSILVLVSFLSVISYAQSDRSRPIPHWADSPPLTPVASKAISHKLGGMMMYKELQDPKIAQSNELRHIMVQGDPSAIRALVEQYKGQYKYAAGDISSVSIPYKNLLAFSQSPAVKAIEISEGLGMGRAFMDTARILNNIDSAHNGYAPLIQSYKGTNVLVGIIDGGIYFRHKDFQRPDGSTRIRYIWDQANITGSPPVTGGGNYGSECDSASINSNSCVHVEPASDQGHGTAAAGIAAGNGRSWETGDAFLRGRYTGTAPESDIIFVRVDNNRQDYLATIADAVNYIFTKADELHMPCVINTSVGTYYGPHDGSELSVQAIENMLDQKNGRVLVAAAGNGGSVRHHVSYQLSATDSLYTWFSNGTNIGIPIYFDLWADTAQFQQANFAIGCDYNNGTVRGRSRYYNAPVDFHPVQGATVEIDDSVFDINHVKLGDYGIAVTAYQGLYHVEFFATPTSNADLWRLQTIGQGTFDLWASKSLIGTCNIPNLSNPAMWPNHRFPDTLKTIVSAWQCSDKVITVANYNNRSGYLDIDSHFVALTPRVGALAMTSSIGPTRDGRIKPDIGATGDVVTTTGDSTYISLLTLTGGANRAKIALGGKHVRDGGTSMASPIVCGCSALYLQEHPNASYQEVKTVLMRTALTDGFTGTVPNTRFGAGKVNCFAALKYQVVYGCSDTAAYNYMANANIDTGGCIPKVYGCTDTASVNYNALANTNNGSCVAKVYGVMDTACLNYNPQANINSGPCVAKVYGITDTACTNYNALANVNAGTCENVGIKELQNGSLTLDVIPNPFSKSATIYISTKATLPDAEIHFYDVLGKSVEMIKLPSGMTQVTYTNKLAAGVYDVAVVSNNSIIAVKKVVVEK